MVLCCAVISIDDASASGGNVKLIWMFLGLHLLLPVVLWFDISGSLFMGGPSPAVLGAMRLLFSSHIYVIPSCLILTILLHVFIGHRQNMVRIVVVVVAAAAVVVVVVIALGFWFWLWVVLVVDDDVMMMLRKSHMSFYFLCHLIASHASPLLLQKSKLHSD
jgi:hypothetical protein